MIDRLLALIDDARGVRVMLVGDFMIDHYLYGNAERISPEAPVLVMDVVERQARPGGAGSVAADLAALGAEVICVGVVGEDAEGEQLRGLLEACEGVDTSGLRGDKGRPTTSKQRLIGLAQHRHRQQLMRIDEEERAALSTEMAAAVLKKVEEKMGDCDVVCLQDYHKGVLCPEVARGVMEMAQRQGKRVLVDPAALDDYGRYRGAWLLKPNRRELRQATGINVDGAEEAMVAAGKLAESLELEHVVVTLDKQGCIWWARQAHEGRHVPTEPRQVYDVTGAGDMMLAVLALWSGAALRRKEEPALGEIIELANVAAGLEVEKFGAEPITRDELRVHLLHEYRAQAGKVRAQEELLRELSWLKGQGKKVVFTNGCFDILHTGHVNLFTFARGEGDVLVVAINSDRSIKANKGPGRPIIEEHDRAAMIAALESVDYVTVFDDDTPIKLIEGICPDVLVKGSHWQGAVVGQEWVERHGGKVVLAPIVQGRSTTNIIEQVLAKAGAERSGMEERS